MAGDPEVIVYMGLGANMDEPARQLHWAVHAIGRLPSTTVIRESPTYGSKPWGKPDQPDFLNKVVEVRTRLEPHILLRQCKQIEEEQGRVESERWGPRPVDIDVLLYGDRTINTATLVVPHPRMWEREFVLRPLADLRPDLTAPDGSLIVDLLARPDISSQGTWLIDYTES